MRRLNIIKQALKGAKIQLLGVTSGNMSHRKAHVETYLNVIEDEINKAENNEGVLFEELQELIHDIRDGLLCMQYPCKHNQTDVCDRIKVRLLKRLTDSDKVLIKVKGGDKKGDS